MKLSEPFSHRRLTRWKDAPATRPSLFCSYSRRDRVGPIFYEIISVDPLASIYNRKGKGDRSKRKVCYPFKLSDLLHSFNTKISGLRRGSAMSGMNR